MISLDFLNHSPKCTAFHLNMYFFIDYLDFINFIDFNIFKKLNKCFILYLI